MYPCWNKAVIRQAAGCRFAPLSLISGFKAKRDHIPPSLDPCAGADGKAMGERNSPSLLNPAGPIAVREGYCVE